MPTPRRMAVPVHGNLFDGLITDEDAARELLRSIGREEGVPAPSTAGVA